MKLPASLFLALLVALPAFAAGPATLAGIEQGIVAVHGWGSTPADPALARPHIIVGITLHHQGETYKAGTDPAQYLRTLQRWSRDTKKWIDIPYHYVVDLEGKTFAARDLRYAGDTNTTYDPKGQALIEVVGNFEDVEPNQQQLDAVVDMMALLVARHGLSIDSIRGHKDHTQTLCPGKNLYRYLESGYFRHKVALRLAGIGRI
ncbi:peptidoglycan recognition protein family protein [Massilia glaciei]|uniref:N-acetylmuramoyl-L-alanine amidase n=1 Tax=Massilia glaciei TaxID=1524097 RepID=A0A2U2HLR3_9BURK|nr:peptidoglycan recognition family protein [Massilia glaciei]PWF48409.1 N-acetylmuramoyl-L-alanine amidase [Massilia glaciei]